MIQTKKRFGQHFLTQPNTIAKIVESFHLPEHAPVIEIGPGDGALTQVLLAKNHPVTAIEIDRDLIALLKTKFALQPFHVIEQDILKVDIAALSSATQCRKIIGNLPYNISTPILFHLLQYHAHIDEMVFMLQKEVVDRMCAKPGSKVYGRLSVMIQQACKVEALFDIGPNSFTPPPKVMSSMVRLIPYGVGTKASPYHALNDPDHFATIVRLAFGQRRKTLRNALKTQFDETLWQKSKIDPNLRAENLTVNDFICLANICNVSNTNE